MDLQVQQFKKDIQNMFFLINFWSFSESLGWHTDHPFVFLKTHSAENCVFLAAFF